MMEIDNEVLKQIWERKSVRVFTEQKISESERKLILDAAIQAPSAGNQQFYTILDIKDEKIKAKMADLCDHQPFIKEAPMVLVFLADSRRWKKVYEEAGLETRPVGPGDALLAVADACIAAQNAAVAAQSMGIGSCYIGDVLENCESMREILQIPDGVLPAAMLVFGYPTKQQMDRKKPARFKRDYIVQENVYRDRLGAEHRNALTDRAKAGGDSHFDYDRWVKAFAERKYESAFSREMSRSAAMYLKDYIFEGESNGKDGEE